MVEAYKEAGPAGDQRPVGGLVDSEVAIRVIAEMLAGRIVHIKPQYDFTTELGYVYPTVEQATNLKGKDAIEVMESLASKGIVNKSFFDRLIRCRRCHSPHLAHPPHQEQSPPR